MNAHQASELVLIQAIESVDEHGEIISFDERRKANAALEGEGAGSPLESVSARAATLAGPAQRRAPWLWQVTDRFSTISWPVTLGFALLSMFLGASVQALDGGKTFHVLSTPFLGLLLWNFVSIGLLFAGPLLLRRFQEAKETKAAGDAVRQKGQEVVESSWGQGALRAYLWLYHKWLDWRKPTSEDLVQQISRKAVKAYWQEWPRHASKLLQVQVARALHLANILFCLSALLTAYSGGLTKAYKATAESTFLAPGLISFLLKLLFLPSQLLLGSLPALKPAADGTLGPAAPWIHHYAVTLALFVIIPRFALFAWSWLQAMWLTLHLPMSMKSMAQVPTLNVALASHTNVGKTSLARTLLRRDVGEVRDAEHVTRRRAGYFLINTPEARLRLWDTPGFGDAKALTQNLKERQGWSWLRSLQEPDLRFDREAALSLKEEADLILYLVPAHADAKVEQTIRDEWEVLHLLGCPVLCILNRLDGASAAEEEQLLARWKGFFSHEALCKDVLSLDAFSRSWRDEQSLFQAIEKAVSPEDKGIASTLRRIWEKQNEQRHDAASSMVAHALRDLSRDSEGGSNKEAGVRLQARAQKTIAQTQNKLLEHMGLKGEIRDRMLQESEEFLRSIIPNRGERTLGAIIGGALSGLASGIVADFLAGGLTFFGGAAVGMVVGALGGVGVAEGYRRTGSRGARKLIWEEDFLKGVALRFTLLYLAAASFGRARGEFTDAVILRETTQNPSSEVIAHTEHQAHLFSAAEAALSVHWPFLWPLLAVDHTPKTKKLWEEVIPTAPSTPQWVHKLQQQNDQNALPTDSTHEAFEKGCAALLLEALEQWSQLRETKQTPNT